jgi:succinylglutamate desuccinylase
MERVSVAYMTTCLTIRNELPDGFLGCTARDLHQLFHGPTLIELEGESGPPLFVSILLHGNEDSGLVGMQRVLREYSQRPLPRSLMLLVGNIEAARDGLRRLPDQPDYNRTWPGTPDHGHTAEAELFAKVHARAVKRGVIAAIDLHNNTGRNPHYSVICNDDPQTLGLASLFSRRAVRFRGIPGTQTASFSGLIPAMTAECGLPGVPANAEAAAQFVDAALNLTALPTASPDEGRLELYHTLGVVRVREDVSFGFGNSEAELRFNPALDENNFRDLVAGTVMGETRHRMPLEMIDEAGRDVTGHYFETSDGNLKLRRGAVPAMFSTDARIVRQDCLCYLMERL